MTHLGSCTNSSNLAKDSNVFKARQKPHHPSVRLLTVAPFFSFQYYKKVREIFTHLLFAFFNFLQEFFDDADFPRYKWMIEMKKKNCFLSTCHSCLSRHSNRHFTRIAVNTFYQRMKSFLLSKHITYISIIVTL